MRRLCPLLVFLSYLALLIFSLFAIYPIARMITIAPTTGDQLLSSSLTLIPRGATVANSRILLTQTAFLRWLVNSSAIALAVTLPGVALASGAGYTLSRFRFPGRSSVLQGLVVTQMLPVIVLLLPLTFLMVELRMINSYVGVVIIYALTALPFCVWQLKRYYDTIPFSLEEAAAIDGCSRWKSFTCIILPLAMPALIVTALFSFLIAWSEYVVATLMLQDAEKVTRLGLPMFQANMSTEWGLYACGALLLAIPLAFIFIVLGRYLVSGLSAGGVKD